MYFFTLRAAYILAVWPQPIFDEGEPEDLTKSKANFNVARAIVTGVASRAKTWNILSDMFSVT